VWTRQDFLIFPLPGVLPNLVVHSLCVLAFLDAVAAYRMRLRHVAPAVQHGLEERIGRRTRIARDCTTPCSKVFKGVAEVTRYYLLRIVAPRPQHVESVIEQARQALQRAGMRTGLRSSTLIT